MLLAEGLTYDSSMSPKYWSENDSPGYRPGLHRLAELGGELYEFPVTSGLWLGRRWVVSGGRHFRCLPPSVIQKTFTQLNSQGVSGQLYIHTYEVLPYKLRIPRRLPTFGRRCLGGFYEAAYNIGRHRTLPRLVGLIKQLSGWQPIRDLVASAAGAC